MYVLISRRGRILTVRIEPIFWLLWSHTLNSSISIFFPINVLISMRGRILIVLIEPIFRQLWTRTWMSRLPIFFPMVVLICRKGGTKISISSLWESRILLIPIEPIFRLLLSRLFFPLDALIFMWGSIPAVQMKPFFWLFWAYTSISSLSSFPRLVLILGWGRIKTIPIEPTYRLIYRQTYSLIHCLFFLPMDIIFMLEIIGTTPLIPIFRKPWTHTLIISLFFLPLNILVFRQGGIITTPIQSICRLFRTLPTISSLFFKLFLRSEYLIYVSGRTGRTTFPRYSHPYLFQGWTFTQPWCFPKWAPSFIYFLVAVRILFFSLFQNFLGMPLARHMTIIVFFTAEVQLTQSAPENKL